MTYDQLIKFFGSQANAAKEIGVGQSTLSYWRLSFPLWRQEQLEARYGIEAATRGKRKTRSNSRQAA